MQNNTRRLTFVVLAVCLTAAGCTSGRSSTSTTSTTVTTAVASAGVSTDGSSAESSPNSATEPAGSSVAVTTASTDASPPSTLEETTTTAVAETTTTLAPTTTLETTTSSTEPAPTTTTIVTAGAVVIVANATKIQGGAAKMSQLLGKVGFQMGKATDAAGNEEFRDTTQVYCLPGSEAVAASVGLLLGGVPVNYLPTPAPITDATAGLGDASVVVMLGKDLAGKTPPELRDR